MRIKEHGDGVATVAIDEYADLLAVRGLPEWHFTGYRGAYYRTACRFLSERESEVDQVRGFWDTEIPA